jgi:hypothetical protein
LGVTFFLPWARFFGANLSGFDLQKMGHEHRLLWLIPLFCVITIFAVIVTVNGRPLNPRLDLYNHSPTGFEWGYCGSGPAQLALAILADHLADDRQALDVYQRFKWAVIVELPRKRSWTLTDQVIDQILQNIRNYQVEGVVA